MSINMNSILGAGSTDNVYNSYAMGGLKKVSSGYDSGISSVSDGKEQSSFDAIFQSALGLINETNDLSNKAEEEELNYAMGLSEDTHTLMIAQTKANVSLEYTVAVRDAVIDAYNEIMNMQF